MEPVGIASVVLGSIVLAALMVWIAADGIKRRRSAGVKQVIPAIDAKWKKLKVRVSS